MLRPSQYEKGIDMVKWLRKLINQLKPKPALTPEEMVRKEQEKQQGREDREIVNRIIRELKSTPEGTKYILVLDEWTRRSGPFPPSLLPHDYQLKLVFERDLVRNPTLYGHDPNLERMLRLLATFVGPEMFDAFLIGHNGGAALWKAELLAELFGDEAVYTKTIIAWNQGFPNDDGTIEYADADDFHLSSGGKHIVSPELFTDRAGLDVCVYNLIGLDPPFRK